MQQSIDTAERRLTTEEFVTEYADRPGKFELVRGKVVRIFDPLAPTEDGELVCERSLHAAVKLNVAFELRRAFTAAGIPLFLFGDGMTIVIGDGHTRAPDAVAIPRASFDPEVRLLTDPIFLCEVLSPSTQRTDLVVKVRDYFAVATVRSYLIVDPDDRILALHSRTDPSGAVLSTLVTAGPLVLQDLVDGHSAVTIDPAAFYID